MFLILGCFLFLKNIYIFSQHLYVFRIIIRHELKCQFKTNC